MWRRWSSTARLRPARPQQAGSHQQAVTTFETVTPYADRLAPAERAALLDDYAWELHIAHRFFDAVQVGEEAIKLREEAGEPAQRRPSQKSAVAENITGRISTA